MAQAKPAEVAQINTWLETSELILSCTECGWHSWKVDGVFWDRVPPFVIMICTTCQHARQVMCEEIGLTRG